jgi:hypothetical protein
MAIIQISKIQQRSGNLVDLPQLDEAQLGWANDAKRLFIGATGNTTTNVENVEVLTSYSTISFSQVEGSDGSNVNISNVRPGQILAYDSSINSWINTGGNANAPGNTAQYSGIPIHLGTVSNVKIGGGADGYILETDGAGNVSWTSKGTLRTTIIGLSNATPVVMTVANTVPYTNGLEITITGANTPNSNVVNGQTFYIQLDANFTANSNVVGSGNVSLFTSPDFANANAVVGTGFVYVANSGVATASLAGGSASTPGGGNTQIQFNDAGILNGSANFVITGGNSVTLTGNFSASNVAGGNLVSANYIAGALTTAAQPNVTSTGTLAGLVVAGNITPSANITYNLGNNTNRFNDLYLANSTIYIGDQTISANSTSVIVSGNLVANITGNVSGNVTSAGTVTTNAQPNITSVGILTSLSVSGNITTGNLDGANSITANYFIGSGNNLSNIQGANVTGAVTYAGTANSVALANVVGAGNIATANLDGSTSNVLYGNGVFAPAAVSYGNSNVATFLASFGSNTITTTGNINAGNITIGGIVSATGNITAPFFIGNGSQLTGILASAGSQIINGNSSVTVAANSDVSISVAGTNNVMVITSTGANIIGTLSVSGNANVSNLNTANAGLVGGNNVTFTTGSNTNPGTFTGNFSLSAGSKLEATYADLAEYYEADQHYEPGTVLAFGGDKEVTIAEDNTARVAGVVSTNPAYAMNANCQGIATAIALQGRVPTKVRGTIHKGDMMVSGGDGYARPSSAPHMGTVIGKSLEDFTGEGIIEVAVGRL